jgi:hypothetical protein
MEESGIAAQEIRSVPELLDLFLHSYRIRVDLERDLETADPQCAVVLRKWDARLESHLEFRSFVCHGELTAITQYDDRMYFEDIVANRELILETIRAFFEGRVKPALANGVFPADSYVADYAIVFEASGEAEVILIELNRFNFNTGAALFDWTADFETLIGVKPFEFRVRTEEEVLGVEWQYHILPELVELKDGIKAEIVQSRKSWFERLFTWRANEGQ